ncbi:MAG: TolC family protein, partial [Asticcacaulis sp.]
MPSKVQPSLPLFRLAPLPATALAAVLCLAGCASVPATTTDTPVALSDLAASQSLAGDTRGEWPDAQWWAAFNDPQLNTLIGEALVRSPDIKAARARLEKAQSYYDQVRAVLTPTATLNASTAETKSSLNMGTPDQVPGFSGFSPKDLLPHGYWNLTRIAVDGSYDLDLWGKSHAALKGSLGLRRAAEIEEAAARDTVAINLTRAYVELDRLYKMRDSLELI